MKILSRIIKKPESFSIACKALEEAMEKGLSNDRIRPIADRYYAQANRDPNYDPKRFNLIHQKYQDYRRYH